MGLVKGKGGVQTRLGWRREAIDETRRIDEKKRIRKNNTSKET